MMNTMITAAVLALSVSADALACGFGAGASRLKVPILSALAAAAVSAGTVAFGMTAGSVSAPFMPEKLRKYIAFVVLAVLGLMKLAGRGDAPSVDVNSDRYLSVSEAVALGCAISLDGLAAGFGSMSRPLTVIFATVFTFAFSAAALYFGAKGGRGFAGGRAGGLAAGGALIILAVQKLLTD